jgi:hypothetical protein
MCRPRRHPSLWCSRLRLRVRRFLRLPALTTSGSLAIGSGAPKAIGYGMPALGSCGRHQIPCGRPAIGRREQTAGSGLVRIGRYRRLPPRLHRLKRWHRPSRRKRSWSIKRRRLPLLNRSIRRPNRTTSGSEVTGAGAAAGFGPPDTMRGHLSGDRPGSAVAGRREVPAGDGFPDVGGANTDDRHFARG